jgi:membrane-associated protease RseP (regulator of RpoE activity)
VILHPVGFAAWFGLFVTSLNLIPIGQLDGGHVAYALWGRKQRTIAMVAVPILIVLGFQGWPGWFLWVGMAGLLGLAHPPVLNPSEDLGATRTVIGWIALAIFILTFAPVPFSVH